MGRRNYLIRGVSGAGKTAVAEALERRGYHVVHGDRTLAYHGDPQTGARLDWPAPDSGIDRIEWGYMHWIWPLDTVKSLLADNREPITFFCGDAKNFRQFGDLFDAVFVLDLDAESLGQRLAARPDDEFGGKPDERAFVLRFYANGDDIPGDAIRIDATAPLDRVVDAVLAHCAR